MKHYVPQFFSIFLESVTNEYICDTQNKFKKKIEKYRPILIWIAIFGFGLELALILIGEYGMFETIALFLCVHIYFCRVLKMMHWGRVEALYGRNI